MKPKTALVEDGFLPPGAENKRGRLSAAAIARCRELSDSGWDIEGYSESKPEQVKEKPKPAATGKEIADIGEPLRDETYWEAYANVNGNVVPIGMRTVEETCNGSLTYCPCPSPRVRHLDAEHPVMVNFKPRKQ